ncbi:hypothetical protein ACI77O_13575 [Pseudomonas tritici]|uniref:hypothetical protein n=1 Tax=Pseudomonas tritici TaxID=2745518 RepID=UPI00387AD448
MTNPGHKLPTLGANYLPKNPTSNDLNTHSGGETKGYCDPKGDSALLERLQALTQRMNNPTLPESFEHSRLGDLITLHQAIAALGHAPDHAAVIEQSSALYDRLRTLHPTMISEQECFMFREQVRAMAEVRNETLGV